VRSVSATGDLVDGLLAIAEPEDHQQIVQRVVEVISRAVPAQSTIALLAVGDAVTFVAEWPTPDRPTDGVEGLRPAHLATVLSDVRVGEPRRTGHALAIPIRDGTTVLGAVSVTRPPGVDAFTDAERLVVRAAATQAGNALALRRARSDGRELAHRLEVAQRLNAQTTIGQVTDTDPESAISAILETARSVLDMDVSFVSRVTAQDQHYDWVSRSGPALGLPAGTARPAPAGYCTYMLAGQLPTIVPDTEQDPIGRELATTTHVGVRAYAGVPLRLPDGRLYGTLCALSVRPHPQLGAVDEDVLRVLAALVGDQLSRREASEQRRQEVVDRLLALTAPEAIAMVTQPIIDLRTGEVSGREALARFSADPTCQPDAVFAEAGRLGVGVEVELAAIAAALDLLPQIPAPTYLSINASPATAVDPRLGRLLASSPVDRLVLELTEHVPIADYTEVVSALAPLRAAGLRLAVDDAGSGYASLAHVLALAPDVLKLDIALTRGVDTDPARRALVVCLVAFARELGTTLVAEGIQSAAELACLRRLGVTYGQGFHLARPERPAAITARRD